MAIIKTIKLFRDNSNRSVQIYFNSFKTEITYKQYANKLLALNCDYYKEIIETIFNLAKNEFSVDLLSTKCVYKSYI